MEAIGTKEKSIARVHVLLVDVYHYLGGGAQGPGQYAAEGMPTGLLWGDDASPHLIGHPGMILGELAETAGLVEIGPTVAHIGYGKLTGGRTDDGGHAGGAHPFLGRIAAGQAVDGLIGGSQGPAQAVSRLWGLIAVIFPEERLNGQSAGYLSGGVASHAIADGIEATFLSNQTGDNPHTLWRAVSVFIQLPAQAKVREGSFLDSWGYRCLSPHDVPTSSIANFVVIADMPTAHY
jgi:hypothetical protein